MRKYPSTRIKKRHVTAGQYLADVLTRVGERDLVDLVGVEPDLPLSALEYGGGKPLLKLQRNLYEREGGRERGEDDFFVRSRK